MNIGRKKKAIDKGITRAPETGLKNGNKNIGLAEKIEHAKMAYRSLKNPELLRE